MAFHSIETGNLCRADGVGQRQFLPEKAELPRVSHIIGGSLDDPQIDTGRSRDACRRQQDDGVAGTSRHA